MDEKRPLNREKEKSGRKIRREATERCLGEGPKIHKTERVTAQGNRNFAGCVTREMEEHENGRKLCKWRANTELQGTL